MSYFLMVLTGSLTDVGSLQVYPPYNTAFIFGKRVARFQTLVEYNCLRKITPIDKYPTSISINPCSRYSTLGLTSTNG